MRGIITENLNIVYTGISESEEVTWLEIVISEDQKDYAKNHINKEVEFEIMIKGFSFGKEVWIEKSFAEGHIKDMLDGNIGPYIMPETFEAAARILLPKEILYTEQEVRQLLTNLVDSDSLYTCRNRSDQYDFVNNWFDNNKKK